MNRIQIEYRPSGPSGDEFHRVSHRSPGSIPFTRNFFESRWCAARKSLATCAAVFSVYKRLTRTQVLRRRASCKVLTQNDRRIHAWSGGKSSVSTEDSRSSSGFEPMGPSAKETITTRAVCPIGVSEFAQSDLISHTIFPYCLRMPRVRQSSSSIQFSSSMKHQKPAAHIFGKVNRYVLVNNQRRST